MFRYGARAGVGWALPGLILFAVGCAASPADRTLVVASDLENPPFIYLEEDKTPAGRDVEMM